MTIKDGQIAAADDVMNMVGKVFKNQAQLIFNADLIGLDSDMDDEYENLKRDVFSTTGSIDQTNSIIKDIPVFGANVLDDFQDNSLDASIWTTTGTVSETGAELSVGVGTSPGVAYTSGASTINFNDACTLFTTFDVNLANIDGENASVLLRDESANEVTLKSIAAPTNEEHFIHRYEINPATNECKVYSDDMSGDSAAEATKDITSLIDGQQWYLKYKTGNGTGAGIANMQVQFLRYLLNAVVSKDFVSEATTASATITDAILVANKSVGGTSSATYWMSADNGSNYESVTLNQIHRFTSTGTQLKVKVTMTNDANDKVYELNQYAVFYNTGAA